MENLKKNEIFRTKLIKEINKARTNPFSYIKLINSYATYFTGKILKLPNQPGFMTNEGISAYNEAANFLTTVKALPPMTYSPGLSHLAHDFIKDLALSEDLDVEENKSYIQNILNKYGNIIELKDIRYCSQFCSISAELFVINLIVCDGDIKREMRRTLFEEQFNFVGVATGRNFLYNSVTSVFFAHDFNEQVYSEQGKKRASVVAMPMEVSTNNLLNLDVFSPLFALSPDIDHLERIDKIIREKGEKIRVSKVMIYTKDGQCTKKIIKQTINE